jgi:glucose/arabinose dehydrogenase
MQRTRSQLVLTLVGASILALNVGAPRVVAQSPVSPFDPEAISITLEPVAEGFDQPVFVTGDRAGRLLVVEQPGRILSLGAAGSLGAFLDITDRVTSGGEQGLLGFALHPGYPDVNRVFVYYTRASDEANVVSEFRAGDAASERVILEMADFAGNHNGGMLAFDRDGMLLIATGDGGGGGDPMENGQNLGSPLGKILRIDIDSGDPYAIPADNPFASDAEAAGEILHYGLRNPWRFGIDRATGDLWIGDVGQGAWEEINLAAARQSGLNFGWNLVEGPDCFAEVPCTASGVTAPVVSVSHDEGVCSIIGGYVYRGTAFPELVGGYLFTDYCTGRIDALDPAAVAQGTMTRVEVGAYDGAISSFGEDDGGELYAVDHGGTLLRVVVQPRS